MKAVLADSEASLLDYLYRSSLRLVVLDPRGAIEWITPQAAAMLVPLAPDGRVDNLFSLLAPQVPDLAALVGAARGAVVCSGLSFDVPWKPEPRVYALDLQWVESDRLLALLADVTLAEQQAAQERTQALADRVIYEARLLASDDLLRRLSAQVPGVLFQLQRDAEGRLQLPFVSHGMAELFGLSVDEVRADPQRWLRSLNPADLPGLLASMEASARTLQTWSHVFRGGGGGAGPGRAGWRQLQAQPLRQSDGGTVWFGFVSDISAQVDAEERLRLLNESLESRVLQRTQQLAVARDAAEQASRSRGEFLAKMSHEIRTPMNAVLGMTHLALRETGDPRLLERLRTIQQSGEHLLGVINDILDFSKIDAGKLELELRPFSLGSVLDTAFVLVAERARSKGLRMTVDADRSLPEQVLGDARRLQQVLLNLLNNAVNYTDAGEVRLKVAPAAEPPGWIRFEVHDTGVGLDAEQQSRLFRSFEQVDNSMARRHGGSGLGLAISQQLVQLMRGEITLHSEPGRGSVFSFTAELPQAPLPAAPPAQVEASAGSAAAAPVAVPDGLRGRRVLLVDDNTFNQIITRELLELEGVSVVVAEDGEQALARLDGDPPYDAVLMDVQMPGMDGLEATRRLRASGRFTGLPVIAMTAHARPEDREVCTAAGMDDFITKPVDPALLYARLARWLQPARPG